MLALGEPMISRSPLANVLLRDGDPAPTGDPDRQGVGLIVLATMAGGQQPHLSGQLRGHVDHRDPFEDGGGELGASSSGAGGSALWADVAFDDGERALCGQDGGEVDSGVVEQGSVFGLGAFAAAGGG